MPTDRGVAGTQPIRVLDNNVLDWFEGKYSGFHSELEDLGKQFGFARHIKYLCGEVPIFGGEGEDLIPYVTADTGQIAIHETFLSYVWGLCYAFLVLFDEEIHGPQTGKQPGHGNPLGFFRLKGYAMLDYALSLVRGFNKWPADLPNPESHNSEDKYYVKRANGIYLAAVDFILCHELAHIALGHLQKHKQAPYRQRGVSSREIKRLENAADKWAFDRILKGIRHPKRTLTTVGFGAIAGLGSLLLLNRNLTSQTHPDINDRIRSVLARLPIDPRDSLWGIAATFYFAWNNRFNGGLDFSRKYETYSALVEAIDSQLESRKQLELNRREKQGAKERAWSLD
jgi:Peptidase U49